MFFHHTSTKFEIDQSNGFDIITPPRNRGGVIFVLQFVCVCLSLCVCVCVCVYVCLSVGLSVCPALLVNKIPVERMHGFGRGFR